MKFERKKNPFKEMDIGILNKSPIILQIRDETDCRPLEDEEIPEYLRSISEKKRKAEDFTVNITFKNSDIAGVVSLHQYSGRYLVYENHLYYIP